MVKAVYIELCLLYWLQKLDYLLKRAESNIPIPVDGGCVFCTDYRNWTICWNVLRATFPFPLMVVVFFVLITETGLFAETCWEQHSHSRWWWLCFLYWLQKLDYLLKRAESNIPIPVDGGCVFCTDYRNWTICWNVLRATFPFTKKTFPVPRLLVTSSVSSDLWLFLSFFLYIPVRLNLCFAVCFAILKILNVFLTFYWQQ